MSEYEAKRGGRGGARQGPWKGRKGALAHVHYRKGKAGLWSTSGRSRADIVTFRRLGQYMSEKQRNDLTDEKDGRSIDRSCELLVFVVLCFVWF